MTWLWAKYRKTGKKSMTAKISLANIYKRRVIEGSWLVGQNPGSTERWAFTVERTFTQVDSTAHDSQSLDSSLT